VTVVQVQGNRVKLGFECPDQIPVHREEIHRRFAVPNLVPDPCSGTDESPYFVNFA
jgi:carbon storage regulator CsrA